MNDKTEQKLEDTVLAYRYRITQFGDWKTESVKEDIRKLINSEVTAVLDEITDAIEHKVPVTSVHGLKPLEDGLYIKEKNLTKAIQTIRKRYE